MEDIDAFPGSQYSDISNYEPQLNIIRFQNYKIDINMNL